MADSYGHSAGNAGERPVTHTAEAVGLPFAIPRPVVRVQPLRSKRAPLSPRAERAGEGRGGEGRAKRGYVHTIGTSSPLSGRRVFSGTTEECLKLLKQRRKARAVYDAFHSLKALGKDQRAGKLIGCCRWFWKESLPCGSYRLIPMRCDDVFCPRCANRRSVPLQKKVLSKMNQSRFEYWFLTVTVKNRPQLTREFLTQMTAWFAELRETELWREHVIGGMYSLEVTFNRETGEWHPHYHVLIEVPKFEPDGKTRKKVPLPRDWVYAIQALWLRLTGDSHVVNVRRIHGRTSKGRLTRKVNMRAIRDLVKYATKSADFAARPELVAEFCAAFKNVRRVQGFGSFLKTTKQVADEEKEKEAAQSAFEPAGCVCGKCLKSDFQRAYLPVHISETVLMSDGTRQLLLFPRVEGESPPWVITAWEPEWTLQRTQLEVNEQRRLAWRDALAEDSFIRGDVREKQLEFASLTGRN